MRITTLVFVFGCGAASPTVSPDPVSNMSKDPNPAPPIPRAPECNGVAQPKLKFTREASCRNDGSVEFCIPDLPTIVAKLKAIAPTIRCGAGAGQAQCQQPKGLLLCSYETSEPGQCTARHGPMTTTAWSQICAVATLSEVGEIVPTWYE